MLPVKNRDSGSDVAVDVGRPRSSHANGRPDRERMASGFKLYALSYEDDGYGCIECQKDQVRSDRQLRTLTEKLSLSKSSTPLSAATSSLFLFLELLRLSVEPSVSGVSMPDFERVPECTEDASCGMDSLQTSMVRLKGHRVMNIQVVEYYE